MIEKNARIDFIDLAKGLCIILVTLGHCGLYVYIPGLSLIRMPLYFTLSGLFFKQYSGFSQFFIKKANRLLIPFLFFYIISYVIFYTFEFITPGLIITKAEGILDVFTQRQYFDGPLWFLLSLFWINIIFYSITLVTNNELYRGLMVLTISYIGICLGISKIFLPCEIDASFTWIIFFYFGYLLRKTSILTNNNYKYTIPLIIGFYLLAFLGEKVFNDPSLYFRDNSFEGNLFGAISMAIFGVLTILLICKIIKRIPIISYFGRYSIIVLCLHHMYYRPIKLVVRYFNFDDSIQVYVVVILTLLLCYASIPLCIRFLPYFTAQRDLITESHVKKYLR